MNKRIVINVIERFSKVKVVTKVADGGPSSCEASIPTREHHKSRKDFFDAIEEQAHKQLAEVMSELRKEIEV